MVNLAFYSISGGLIGAGLNLLRQLKVAQRTGEKINWGDVFWAGFEGALLGTFFGFCGLLAVSMSSALIFFALGCSSFLFAALSLVQADADLKNGDYDLFLLDLLFAFLGFKGAEACFDAAVIILIHQVEHQILMEMVPLVREIKQERCIEEIVHLH